MSVDPLLSSVIVDEYYKAVQTREFLSQQVTAAIMAGKIAEAMHKKEVAVSWIRSLERILREAGFTEGDVLRLHNHAICKLHERSGH